MENNIVKEAELKAPETDELLGTEVDVDDVKTQEDELEDLDAEQVNMNEGLGRLIKHKFETTMDESVFRRNTTELTEDDIASMINECVLIETAELFADNIIALVNEEDASLELVKLTADELLGTEVDVDDVKTQEDELEDLKESVFNTYVALITEDLTDEEIDYVFDECLSPLEIVLLNDLHNTVTCVSEMLHNDMDILSENIDLSEENIFAEGIRSHFNYMKSKGEINDYYKNHSNAAKIKADDTYQNNVIKAKIAKRDAIVAADTEYKKNINNVIQNRTSTIKDIKERTKRAISAANNKASNTKIANDIARIDADRKSKELIYNNPKQKWKYFKYIAARYNNNKEMKRKNKNADNTAKDEIKQAKKDRYSDIKSAYDNYNDEFNRVTNMGAVTKANAIIDAKNKYKDMLADAKNTKAKEISQAKTDIAASKADALKNAYANSLIDFKNTQYNNKNGKYYTKYSAANKAIENRKKIKTYDKKNDLGELTPLRALNASYNFSLAEEFELTVNHTPTEAELRAPKVDDFLGTEIEADDIKTQENELQDLKKPVSETMEYLTKYLYRDINENISNEDIETAARELVEDYHALLEASPEELDELLEDNEYALNYCKFLLSDEMVNYFAITEDALLSEGLLDEDDNDYFEDVMTEAIVSEILENDIINEKMSDEDKTTLKRTTAAVGAASGAYVAAYGAKKGIDTAAGTGGTTGSVVSAIKKHLGTASSLTYGQLYGIAGALGLTVAAVAAVAKAHGIKVDRRRNAADLEKAISTKYSKDIKDYDDAQKEFKAAEASKDDDAKKKAKEKLAKLENGQKAKTAVKGLKAYKNSKAWFNNARRKHALKSIMKYIDNYDGEGSIFTKDPTNTTITGVDDRKFSDKINKKIKSHNIDTKDIDKLVASRAEKNTKSQGTNTSLSEKDAKKNTKVVINSYMTKYKKELQAGKKLVKDLRKETTKEDRKNITSKAYDDDKIEKLVVKNESITFNEALDDIIKLLSEEQDSEIDNVGVSNNPDETELKAPEADELYGTQVDVDDVKTQEDELEDLTKDQVNEAADSGLVKQKLMGNGWSITKKGRYDEEMLTAKALGEIKSTLGLELFSMIPLLGLPAAVAANFRFNNNLERINSDNYKELREFVRNNPRCKSVMNKIKAELLERHPDNGQLKKLRDEFYKVVGETKDEYKKSLSEALAMLAEELEDELTVGTSSNPNEAELKAPEADELYGTQVDVDDVKTQEDELEDLTKDQVQVTNEEDESDDDSKDDTEDKKSTEDSKDEEDDEDLELEDEKHSDDCECPECKDKEDKADINEAFKYTSLLEAVDAPAGFFDKEDNMCRLKGQIACTIAKENGDLLYSELERAISEVKAIKAKIAEKYATLSAERANDFVNNTQALTDETHVSRGLFTRLGEQIEINNIKKNLSKPSEKEVIYEDIDIFDN